MSISLEQIKSLVSVHTPVLRLHHQDKYMPCSADFFIQHSELLLGDKPGTGQVSPRPSDTCTTTTNICLAQRPCLTAAFT